jgi:catechol 2,3-dioxygenase-like lactoylglutathione lyase family enzyme
VRSAGREDPGASVQGFGDVHLDHMILPVADLSASIEFYRDVLGLEYGGEDDPFSVMRVTPEFSLLLAPFGMAGGEHLAFAMEPDEFEAVFARIRAAGLEYGDAYNAVGNMRGPGDERGAKALYVFDPSRHLIEIRHYATR